MTENRSSKTWSYKEAEGDSTNPEYSLEGLMLKLKTSILWPLDAKSQITADGDCSHEIKRHLFLGRKVMTNLYSIFKSRHIILPTKVHIVKVMVFPVVMYGCENWTVKKAEC